MNLVEELEYTAKQVHPWTEDEGYILSFSDLRDLLEKAAKRIKELEKRAYGAVQK